MKSLPARRHRLAAAVVAALMLPVAAQAQDTPREDAPASAAALTEVTVKPLDEEIVSLIRATPQLGACRALDAAHVATALYFSRAADTALKLCTFDARMAQVAARVGLSVAGVGT